MDYFFKLFQFFNLICKHNLIVIDSSSHYITSIMTLGKHQMLVLRKWVTHILLMRCIVALATQETVWQLSTKLKSKEPVTQLGSSHRGCKTSLTQSPV